MWYCRKISPGGQRVESFKITGDFPGGENYPLYQGTCIGHKKICQLQDPFAEQNPLIGTAAEQARRIRVRITGARDTVFLREIKVY